MNTYIQISDEIILANRDKPIVQVHRPTNDYDNEEVEKYVLNYIIIY